MFELPPPLAALRHWRQFIVFKLVPSAVRPGKTDKFPINFRTGQKHDAHDPAIWLSVDDAAAYALAFGPDHGVGFVLTEQDDLWFLDIDDCLTPTGWNDWALYLMSVFNGAAWEISSSGRGLHGLGHGRCPPHRTRYFEEFEFYTSNRFVALTGTSAVGEVNTDHSAAITKLVADYLTRDPNDKFGDWTTQPVERWRGNADDDELITRAINSPGGAAAALGYRAHFRDLWEANGEELAKFWPETNPNKSLLFNASKADAALAQALAFWTGNNCERIERLMRRSALVREKWDSHASYMEITIRNAVGRQTDVLQDKPPALIADQPTAIYDAPMQEPITGNTYLRIEDQRELFKGCVYVIAQHRALIPGGEIVKPEAFKVKYGRRAFVMDDGNERISRDAWDAFTQNNSLETPIVDDLTFQPRLQPAAIVKKGGRKYVNTWWPIETPCAPGDATPWTTHLEKLFTDPRDREIITSYLAAIVQYPGWKFQWAPLIQGIEGNGKTFIVTAIGEAVGEKYMFLPNVNDLAETHGKFTGWLRGKLFIGLEEIRTDDRRNMVEVLKKFITNSRVEIQNKGQDQTLGDNVANFIACSNHKDAIPKNNRDRRWAIFYTAQQEPGDLERDGMSPASPYMPNLWNWANNGGFAIINHHLKNYPIREEFNPATSCHRAPTTTSTGEAIELSAGGVEQEIIESIEQGSVGFSGGWISSHFLDLLLKRMRAEKAIPPRKRRDLLKTLGYDWHPAFSDMDGRSPIVVKPDAMKPRIFAKIGHLVTNIKDPRQAAKRYETDQTQGAIDNASFGTGGT